MDDEFIIFMKENGLAENTYNSYANDIKIFKEYYEDSYGEPLVKLVHADIAMYSSYLMKNNSAPTTINRKVAALKKYNLFLVEKGIQKDIVIIDKDFIKIQKSIIDKPIPSIQEVNKLKHFTSVDQKNAKRDYCCVVLFLYGGVRESELVNLRIIDIHLEERMVNIIGKGNKFRRVIINNDMYNAIKDYLEERINMNIDSPYLFVGQKTKSVGGKALNRNFCNRLLDRYKEICKIAILHPHLLRSYFCSNALHNAGYTIEQVANQAGHSSLNTTRGYLSSEHEDLVSKANKM